MEDSPIFSSSCYLPTRTHFYMHTLYPNVFFVMFTEQPPTAIYASLTAFLFHIEPYCSLITIFCGKYNMS